MKWLNRQRLTIYPRILLGFYVLLLVVMVLMAARSETGLIDLPDAPLGRDFSYYWLASSLAQSGDPGVVYNLPKFAAAQEAYFRVKAPNPWFYPPTFLLMLLPLALLPYLAALGGWLAASSIAYLAVVRRIAPHPQTLWLALAFPGFFQNFFQGQNGCLSLTLMGGGLLLLERWPWVAGFLLGALSFKPHLFALVPVALVAGRHWRALLGVLAANLGLGLASLLVLGPAVWTAYWQNLTLPMNMLREGLLPVEKMFTILPGLLLAGAGLVTAMAVQVAIMVATALGVFWVWRRETALPVRAATLVVGTLLFSPYGFSYDLVLLALPLAWLGWEGYNCGFKPGEQGLLLLAWLLPFLVVFMGALKLQLAPLILAGLFISLLKRHRAALLTQ